MRSSPVLVGTIAALIVLAVLLAALGTVIGALIVAFTAIVVLMILAPAARRTPRQR